MLTSVHQYLTQFNAANDEFVALVAGCNDTDWQRITESEGWTVAAVAHHVAERNGVVARMITRLAAGDTDILHLSRAELHEENATHAAEHATVGKQETLDLLRVHATAFILALEQIDDTAFLDRTIEVFAGNDLSVTFLIREVVIAHVVGHGASIQATVRG